MNELDKQLPENGDVNFEVAAESAAVNPDASAVESVTVDCDNVNAVEGAENECVETVESVPDIADEAGKAAAEVINFHAMSLEELVEALRGIVASGNMEAHKEVSAIKQAYYTAINRKAMTELAAFVEAGNSADQFSATPEATENEIKTLLADFREKRAAYLEMKEQERKENLEKKNEILRQLSEIVADIDNINVHFPKFQELQAEFKSNAEVPAGSETELWKNYQAVVEQFYDHLKMNKVLRDLDFKKNLEIKKGLVEKARELTEAADPIEAFRKLQSLHEEWRETGPVAKEVRDELWNDFKEASATINRRHQDYFQARKTEEAENEARKTALCEKVEAIDVDSLRSFADWDAKTKEIIEIQKEYKEVGFASRKANSMLFARFRKACDEFFNRKGEYFKKIKDEFKENLQKKESLCEKAEAILARANEKSAFEELQELQKEWRTVGVVRRKQGDDVWKRFCAAVDAFHAARKQHFGAQRSAEMENLAAKQAVISELKAIPSDAERNEVIGKIRELQNRWLQIGFVPFKHKDAVNSEYRAELDRLFGSFDVKENTRRMRRFENDVKKLGGDENKLGRERERLMRTIEAREAEIKTIENNLGFFKFQSKKGNSMVSEFERKIEKIKEEVAQLHEKIALLDKEEK